MNVEEPPAESDESEKPPRAAVGLDLDARQRKPTEQAYDGESTKPTNQPPRSAKPGRYRPPEDDDEDEDDDGDGDDSRSAGRNASDSRSFSAAKGVPHDGQRVSPRPTRGCELAQVVGRVTLIGS